MGLTVRLPVCCQRTFGKAALLVLLVAGCLLARPVEGQPRYWFDHVRVTLEAGGSPFHAVQLGMRRIDGGWVVWQTKQYPYVPVYDNRVSVAAQADGDDLMALLEGNGLLELKDAASDVPFGLTFRIEAGWKGRSNALVVRGAELLDDIRYAAILQAIRSFVESRTGVARFRDLVLPESELGLLNLRTFPPAEVEIDGVSMGRETPLNGLELGPGVHVARLRPLGSDKVRRVKFTVYKGQVTNLNLNLDETQ
ncbi:MAG: hypothetical protein FJ109_03430 [Deltaproteobacteria bacterium]|nr:hypothetical protein [Deltaproteobacteria bacterium]